MLDDVDRFIIITGGPGSGKSTLIDALERAGHARSMEAGRGIIKDQVAIGGNAVNWGDRALFAELMLSWEMRSYRMAQEQQGLVFFDRGVPEIPGYFRMMGLPVPEHAKKAAEVFRYNHRVFIAPPWREIFRQDEERKQDFAEAVRSWEAAIETYREWGYELIELPKVTVAERARFVLERCGALPLSA